MRESLWPEPRWNAGRRARPQEGARAAARKAAVVTEQRLTAFRFLFLSFVIARSEATKQSRAACIEDWIASRSLSSDRATSRGSVGSQLRAAEPDRDEAGHHRRIYLTKVGF